MIRNATNRAFDKACGMKAASRYRDNVAKPRVLSIDRVRKGLEALSSSRQVYVQGSGDGIPMVKLATVRSLLQALDELAEFPKQSAVYVVCKAKAREFSAWPIIWQGIVQRKYVLVAYVDPIRYGFNSQSKSPLTIGPAVPMPQKRRKNGLWIDYDADGKKLSFAPRGEVCSSRALTSRYGPHWREVLKKQLRELPRAKGQQRQYEAASPLPSKEEYEELARKWFTKSVPQMIDEAYGTIEELGQELQEIYDATPESLQGTEVAQAREQTALECDSIASSKPDVPQRLRKLMVYHLPSPRITSRGDQAYEASRMLRNTKESIETSGVRRTKAIDEFLGDLGEPIEVTTHHTNRKSRIRSYQPLCLAVAKGGAA